jgi:hypothetical protein
MQTFSREVYADILRDEIVWGEEMECVKRKMCVTIERMREEPMEYLYMIKMLHD